MGVVDARFARPLDRELILGQARQARLVVTLEESVLPGGFGSAVLELLVDAGADLDIRNSGGVTPLMQAAGQGRRDIVKQLLLAGARVDFKDYQGSSAADWARRSGDQQLSTMLSRRNTRLIWPSS